MATKVSKVAPAAEETMAFQAGSGNVFADLGLPNPDELMFKADLATRLTEALRASGLAQRPAAARLGWTQPEVSAFLNGRISGFSVERIMRALTKMGKRVEVHILDEAGESVLAV